MAALDATQLAAFSSDQIAALSAAQLVSVNQEQAALANNTSNVDTRIVVVGRPATGGVLGTVVPSLIDHLSIHKYQGLLDVASIAGYPTLAGTDTVDNSIFPAIPGADVLTSIDDLETPGNESPPPAANLVHQLSVPSGYASADDFYNALGTDANTNYNAHPVLYWAGGASADLSLPAILAGIVDSPVDTSTYNSNGFINGLLDAARDTTDRNWLLNNTLQVYPGYGNEVPKDLFLSTNDPISSTQLAELTGDIVSAFGIDVNAAPATLAKEVNSAEAAINRIRAGGTANVIEGTSSLGAILVGDGSAIGQVLKQISSGAGDASAIANGIKGVLFGWQEGGILGGAQAGSSAASAVTAIDTLVNELSANSASTGQADTADIIGAIIALLTTLFGNHDNPANMPDKYDTARYGQEVADLQGVAGANGENFTESSPLTHLFDGRTGIQAVEETLAEYGSAANSPAWLKPQYDELESLFGVSRTGAGTLSFGHAINNEQVTGTSGTDGAVHQYTDLANALYTFADAYAAVNTITIVIPQGVTS